MTQLMINPSQGAVNGNIWLRPYIGNGTVVGRRSMIDSLLDESLTTFEDNVAYVIN